MTAVTALTPGAPGGAVVRPVTVAVAAGRRVRSASRGGAAPVVRSPWAPARSDGGCGTRTRQGGAPAIPIAAGEDHPVTASVLGSSNQGMKRLLGEACPGDVGTASGTCARWDTIGVRDARCRLSLNVRLLSLYNKVQTPALKSGIIVQTKRDVSKKSGSWKPQILAVQNPPSISKRALSVILRHGRVGICLWPPISNSLWRGGTSIEHATNSLPPRWYLPRHVRAT